MAMFDSGSPLVLTMNVFGLLTVAERRPGPVADTRLGSQPRRAVTQNGEPGTCIPL